MKIGNLPKNLEKLNHLVMNMWWAWHQEVWDLFSRFNPQEWEKHHNPIKTIQSAHPKTIEAINHDPNYCQKLEETYTRLQHYLNREDRWFLQTYPERKDTQMAYFSAEYGIHESLRIYSGGLGILSGDHVKSASDLGIPLNFIGLFYHEGYFTQQITIDGQQVDCYERQDPAELPLQEVYINNTPLRIRVMLNDREAILRVWKLQVGRSNLFLLDADLPENPPLIRELTARLYGGDRETRICQEIILGIGGLRALQAMGIDAKVFHMNEGHSAFFQLERIAQTMHQMKFDFSTAKQICQSNCLFTTHTPVPAGNEAFNLDLMEKYFKDYVENNFKIPWGKFLQLGLIAENSMHKYFSLTVLAINLSSFYNGVSELHGKIAQKMWKFLWPNIPPSENPISHITNGIHVKTWCSAPMQKLFAQHLGNDWEKHLNNPTYWEQIYNIPNIELRNIRHQLKAEMIELVRSRLKAQLKRNGAPSQDIEEVNSFLQENILTIGFARRFATYKRATLIFKDPDRLAKLVNDPQRPIQFIFAGKAHPADIPGQELIKQIYAYSRQERFKGKIIILEDYDMNLSRHMVAGVDVWLNNPRRPMEASGTSGQKVPINGGINFSVLDGWWREGFNGENGWSIGFEKDYPNEEAQDNDDANNFYEILQNTIAPLFYEGEVSHESDHWIEKAKISLVTNIARFSTYRMVQDYTQKFYILAEDFYHHISQQEKRTNLTEYEKQLISSWPALIFTKITLDYEQGVHEVPSRFAEFKDAPSHHTDIPYDFTLPGKVFYGNHHHIEVEIYLAGISPKDIICEAVITTPGGDLKKIIELDAVKEISTGTYLFKNDNTPETEEQCNLRIRLRPRPFKELFSFDFKLMHWM